MQHSHRRRKKSSAHRRTLSPGHRKKAHRPPSQSPPSAGSHCDWFRCLFSPLISPQQAEQLFQRHKPRHRRQPILSFSQLLSALVYHVLMGSGSLQSHVQELLGIVLSGSALSQRRQRLPWQVFADILAIGLRPRAQRQQHRQAFYRGLRLIGLDGTSFALCNVPRIVRALGKAASRRFRAAFARVRVVVLWELGLHNPIAAALGRNGEGEFALAGSLLAQLPPGSLLLADRLYGVPAFVIGLLARCRQVGTEFLVRIPRNLKPRNLSGLRDGSLLVQLHARGLAGTKGSLIVREIRGRVRTRAKRWVSVRLWTSLLDARRYPASELLALYGQRWEVELATKELKIDVAEGERLASYTVETAAQEIAALLLAQAALAQVRTVAAQRSQTVVLRISFTQTLRLVRVLWTLLVLGEGIHTAQQVGALVQRTWEQIGQAVNPDRRARSCPRAVRQPVTGWPRLLRRQEWKGPFEYEVIPHRKIKS